jgi:hypothetical protein
MAFFKFLSFRMQLLQKHTLHHHKSQCNLSRFMALFLYFFFSDIVIWPSRGPVCFRLIVLVSLRFCTNLHPSPITILYVYHRFVCSRAGPGDMAICCPMYASTPMLDALMRLRRPSTVIVDTDNRTLQTTWTLFALSKMGGERLPSRVSRWELCSR